MRQNGDPIPRLHPQRDQAIGKAVHQTFEIGVSILLPFIDQRDLVGCPPRLHAQNIADKPLPDKAHGIAFAVTRLHIPSSVQRIL